MSHKQIVILVIAIVLISAIVIGGAIGGKIAVENSRRNNGNKSISFNSPDLVGKDKVILPASGKTKRNITAVVYGSDGQVLEDNPVTYELSEEVEGITVKDNLMIFDSSAISGSVSFTVTATDAAEDPMGKRVYDVLKIEVKKDDSLSDVPANPIEKEEWELFYNDEFDGDELDESRWTPYYLRHWTDDDEKTKADYYFEDGAFVLRCPEGMDYWSAQDSSKVKGVMSFERNHLHKFGELGRGATYNRNISTFDGFATKYGYFEIRLKMPDTNDGSHFAWWMIGTQDDQNPTAQLTGEEVPYAGHYSNQTGEFDIIETYLTPLKKMKAWRPVIHTNGSTDYEYHWVDKFDIPGDPSREYHIYGFEWDENGTKFYVDNQLAGTSDRTPNYRMMTIFSTYAKGGMGADRGIYPKDAYIDYFRVYKKAEAPYASSVVINGGASPECAFIPASGVTEVPMSAYALDQFDKPIDAKIKWKLSETVDGFQPSETNKATTLGVSIDEKSGVLTVNSGASPSDVFVTAYVNDSVKQTVHIKLSDDESIARGVAFESVPKTVSAGSNSKISAYLYDQYGAKLPNKVEYSLSADITGEDVSSIEGAYINTNGEMYVGESVKSGTVLFVTAKSHGFTATYAVKVS